MPLPPDTSVSRQLRLLLWLIVGVLLLLAIRPWAELLFYRLAAEPRAVTPRGELASDEQSTIEIFRNASPSVVFITTLSQSLDLWSRNLRKVRQGTGSGFVWDELGHVVTNYHVIKGASSAWVRLNDQRSYQAVLVGASPTHDLAVLRISVAGDHPPALPIGRSGNLEVGQKVFAIGNPFGLDHTLTTGIISALDRTIGGEENDQIENLIQTDAAINPGNSGGPLLDSAGRLIGVNTAIYSPSGAYAGIGFAVPVDLVNRVVPDLIAYGSYQRPTLGVVVDEEVNQIITGRLGINGVVLLRVEPGSNAARAGLIGTRLDSDDQVIPGDIIQSIDGQPITRVSDLLDALAASRVGDRLRLGIWRRGSRQEVEVLLEAARQR